MKTLILKFSGPLQSWGGPSNFETRHTDYYPTKSAVIGLIAASFGYLRDNDEAIMKFNELDFAVRVDQPGHLTSDYHIAHQYNSVGKTIRNYVTNRYYLEDAVFLVGISHDDDSFIESIESAIKEPYFQQFMGRRSLPAPYDLILDSTRESLIDSIKKVPWQASEWYKKEKPYSISIYADSKLIDSKDSKMRHDRAVSFSQKNRIFGLRSESRVDISLDEITNI